jgi:hypothetical protein
MDGLQAQHVKKNVVLGRNDTKFSLEHFPIFWRCVELTGQEKKSRSGNNLFKQPIIVED